MTINVSPRARQGELPEGQEKVPWGMTPSRRFSSNYTNFINLYPSTAAVILHFPFSILHSQFSIHISRDLLESNQKQRCRCSRS